MLQLELTTALAYDVTTPSHFCFNLQVMHASRHTLHEEQLDVRQDDGAAPLLRQFVDPLGNRFLRFDAQPGRLTLRYRARVDLAPDPRPATLPENPVTALPDDVLRYVYPSRYCESDVMGRAAMQLFGHLPMGVERVQAIVDWIRGNVQYLVGSTNATTSAREVFVQRAGVCRDFAHLSITLCRALNIPARLVVGYCYFDEPPQDFHAVFEAWLGDRWVMFDPTGLADAQNLVRVGHGSDAKDVAFLTAFGGVRIVGMRIDVDEHHVASGRRRASKPEDCAVLALPPTVLLPA